MFLFLFVLNSAEWFGSRILESPSLGLGRRQETGSCLSQFLQVLQEGR